MGKPDHSPLMKTCSVCGLQKPLAAFLQYAGKSGAHYGNICSTCRKAEAEKAQKPKVEEEGTTSKTGRTIDAKARVEAEAEKRKDQKEVSEEYYEEREEKDVAKTEKAEKIISIEKEEKKHRDSFLDRSYVTKKEAVTKSVTAQRAEEGVKQAAVREEGAKKAETNKNEDIAKNIQAGGTTITAGMDLTEKFKGGSFRAFMTHLGTSPIGRAFARNAQATQKATQEKSAVAKDANAPTKNAIFSKDTPSTKETLSERIEKNWGPGKKR